MPSIVFGTKIRSERRYGRENSHGKRRALSRRSKYGLDLSIQPDPRSCFDLIALATVRKLTKYLPNLFCCSAYAPSVCEFSTSEFQSRYY
jgi:hypothetical protein